MECVFCNHHLEDSEHLFSSCPFVIDVFEDFHNHMKWCAPPIIENDVPSLDYLLELKASFSISQVEFFAITWWFVWYNRNGVIFRHENCSPIKVSMMIKAYV